LIQPQRALNTSLLHGPISERERFQEPFLDFWKSAFSGQEPFLKESAFKSPRQHGDQSKGQTLKPHNSTVPLNNVNQSTTPSNE